MVCSHALTQAARSHDGLCQILVFFDEASDIEHLQCLRSEIGVVPERSRPMFTSTFNSRDFCPKPRSGSS